MNRGLIIVRRTIDSIRRANYSVEDDDRNESLVMGCIHGYYKEALDRLPASMDSLVHEAGFCFGFLDPVSNIITNAAAFYDSPAGETKRGQKRRSRARISSKAKGKGAAGSKSGDAALHGSAVTAAETQTSSIEAQSLRGLVTFLTTRFRHLSRSEALRYLRLAKADLLVAVRLIEEDRDSEAFTVHGPTTKVALTCAALSAFHPRVTGSDDPKVIRLVYGCLTPASCLDEVSRLLAAPGRLCASTLSRLSKMLLTPSMHQVAAESGELMRHAISRFPPSIQKTPFPFDLELALMKVLRDRIHGFYLKAISCIPASSLRLCHHRGLLKAGHCYGQFDPVTNIILNTIWYDIAFPAEQTFEAYMINDESISRVECRSLHGLIAFITTLFPALSTYDATRYLLLDNARLDLVILRANLDGYQTSIPPHDAYKAAACAAHHPTAIANFAMELVLEEGVKLQSLLQTKGTLSPDDIQSILSLVQTYPRSKPVVVQKLTSRASRIVSAKRKDFEANQSLICENVQAALRKHAQDEGEEYELLTICGVNAQIPKNGKNGYYENYNGYPFSHVNIWARLKGSHLVDVAPTLLFIQCANDFEDMEDAQSLCLPVLESSKDAGRCFHCEYYGTKIVHPTSQTYLGQSFDFEEMARKEHDTTNEELVRAGELKSVFIDTWEDDCIYFDPAWDADFAARLNRNAKSEHEWEDGASARAKISKVKEVLQEMVAFINGKW